MNKKEKEDRSEWISVQVTPSVKKEFGMAKDNKELQDHIIRRHIQSETDWLEHEMKDVDEATIKYRAKLINIKDNFDRAQDDYVEQIEKIYEKANKTFSKIDKLSSELEQKMKGAYKEDVNPHNLESLLRVVNTYNNMGDDEKELIKLLLEKKQS